MNWTGLLDRSMRGTLTHPPLHADGEPSVINFAAAPGDDGTLLLQADAPEKHWRGHISADRKSWVLQCKFGFRISGTVKWEGGRFVLTQTHHECPADLLLPNEAAVVEVAA